MSDKKKGKFWQFLKEKVQPVIGDAVSIVGDVTGIEAIEKVGDLLNRRRDEDAKIAALAEEFEMKRMEFEMELHRMDLEAFKIEVEDKQSARSREVEYLKATGGKRDWVQGGLVIFNMTTLLLMLVFLAFKTVPEQNMRIFDMLLGGVVVSGANSIYQYYFGSSRGSRQKDETISKMK
jgi:hypothetical protein